MRIDCPDKDKPNLKLQIDRVSCPDQREGLNPTSRPTEIPKRACRGRGELDRDMWAVDVWNGCSARLRHHLSQNFH